ncbi:MAG: imidazolonepropionase [Actinomycetota bacterium]
MSSLVVRNAAAVFSAPETTPIRGADFEDVEALAGASVTCDGRTIEAVGEARRADTVLDASGCVVLPGFVDCHTHLPFFGWRADEDAARLSGASYESLHGSERGIYRSSRLLRDASDQDVLTFSEALATEMLNTGTTTFETKSGYGLSVEEELRQLRLARWLKRRIRQLVVPTCLAAHAVPPDKDADGWMDEVIDELLPRAAGEELASFCDIYVEEIAFTRRHAERLADKTIELGMRPRMHADQLADGGTAAFAAQRKFASADHLNHASTQGVAALARSDTAAVLLPGATFTLAQEQKPPARDLIDSGAIVALGTDLNPGTSPLASMLFVISLACRLYELRPVEAVVAATVNSAWVLGVEGQVGRLAPGYLADMVVLEMRHWDEIAYRPDHNPILAVICRGEIAHIAPRAQSRLRTSA